MQQVSLRAALDMLPQYNPKKSPKKDVWVTKGARVLVNAKVTPLTVDKFLTKIVARFDDAGQVPVVKWVDVTGDNVWVLHRHLRTKSLEWLYRHLRTFQKLPLKKLPIYVLHKGRIIIWNGTHRMTLGRLLNMKIRARVIDLDKYLRDERKGLVKPQWRVKVPPKKRKRRGKAKHR